MAIILKMIKMNGEKFIKKRCSCIFSRFTKHVKKQKAYHSIINLECVFYCLKYTENENSCRWIFKAFYISNVFCILRNKKEIYRIIYI